MSYEYGTQGATLDFPNPYRVENLFLALRGLLLLGAAVWLLVLARSASGAVVNSGAGSSQFSFVLLLVAGAALALLAVWDLTWMARQLRLYFGRGQPASLAPDIAQDRGGSSKAAQDLAETLRRGSIALAEPRGALNGVLYSLAKHLITAPLPLRQFVQHRFANLLAAASLLLFFAVTLLVAPEPRAQRLAALVYVVLGGLLIVRSYALGRSRTVELGPLALVALLLFAVVGTVFVGKAAPLLPDLAPLSLPTIAAVLLLSSALIEAAGLWAGLKHVDEPPPASTAVEQVAVSFNTDPNLLMHELDRELQSRWTEQIPNRRYIWQAPVLELTAQAGNFAGSVLEETQPMPPQAVRKMNWSTVLAFPRFAWLAVLDGIGIVATLIGCLLWVALAYQLPGIAPRSTTPVIANWAFGSVGLILIVVGGYALRVAHALWGRIDFESRLIWIEMAGSFARAQVGVGNQWADRLRSERSVVNVESMTLRAWVVDVRSVLFDYRDADGRDGDIGGRVMVGMIGVRDQARHWVELVRKFAQSQSTVVMPAADEDARRLAQHAAQNRGMQALAGEQADPQGLLAALAGDGPGSAPATSAGQPARKHCHQCGEQVALNAKFCQHCGAALSA